MIFEKSTALVVLAVAAAAFLVGVELISRAETGAGTDIPGTRLEREGEPFRALRITTDAGKPLFGGGRPELSVSCGDLAPSLFFQVAQPPASPPPLRGVFATVRVDDRPPVRLEVGYADGDDWTPRNQHPLQEGGNPPEQEAQLVRAIAMARTVTLDGLFRWGPERVTWSIDLPDEERRRFLSACEPPAITPE